MQSSLSYLFLYLLLQRLTSRESERIVVLSVPVWSLLAFYAIGIDSAVPNRPVGIYAVASILYGFIAAV